MNVRASTLSAIVLIGFARSSAAQIAAKPEPPKSDVQLHAEALMDHARRLSDIRAKDAPAFRLKATFTFPGKDLNAVQGTYTEIWVSNSQWRRDIVAGNSHRIEVGAPDKRWLLDSTPDFPEAAAKLPELMKMFPGPERTLDFASMDESADQKASVQCAVTKPGAQGEKYAFCFDKKSGALLEKGEPDIRPKNSVTDSCLYGIFRKLGNFWYPREMACFEEKHKRLEAKVEELSVEASPDPALFKPPAGATELENCSTTLVPAVPTMTPGPLLSSFWASGGNVKFELLINEKGNVRNAVITQSSGIKDMDSAAQRAVSGWRFKPATCNGVPVPTQIKTTFNFSSR
jgi:TonB family protein